MPYMKFLFVRSDVCLRLPSDSTLNEDGKTLTPKWKYEYQYDTLGTMTEKKAYRWDAEQMNWTPAYLLTWRTEGPTLQKLSENK